MSAGSQRWKTGLFVAILQAVQPWLIRRRVQSPLDGGGEQEDLDERHDLQGRKVSEDGLHASMSNKTQSKSLNEKKSKSALLLTTAVLPQPTTRGKKAPFPKGIFENI